MGSETKTLPKIDFTSENLKPGTPEWTSGRLEVQEALQEFGCFEASFDRIPAECQKSLFGALEELFDLPLEVKMRNSSNKPFHGYVGRYPQIPLYESMGIDDADIAEKVETFTHIFWPQGNSNFSETLNSYSVQLSELDRIVRRMILEFLGVEKYMDEHMESTNYLLRVMKYREPQTNETKLGLQPHSDSNTVTILCQNQVQGLEILTKDGMWIDVKPSPDSFIVMIGESLRAWTNGRVHSPHHRVMMRGNEARYSVGLFSIPKAGYMVKIPDELVDEQHPLLFNPFDHVEFLAFYYTLEGQKARYPLKAYCGAVQENSLS